MAGTGNDPSRQTVVESTRALLDMPFLDSVESSDAAAMRELRRMASTDTNKFVEVLAHPNLDDGITDQEAKVIAVMSSAYKYTPDSLPVLLDGLDGSGGVYVEERVIQLPLAGETLLAIIRFRNQITASMDYLEHAVRFIEEFISEPFPTNYVALYFGPNPGINIFSHSHIMLESDYDIVGGSWWYLTPQIIAHEIAHYYWDSSSLFWMNEGPAEMLATTTISDNAGTGAPIAPYRSHMHETCSRSTFQTIVELERSAKGTAGELSEEARHCSYSMGERFFLNLYNTLGDTAFRRGFRSLYLKSSGFYGDFRDDSSDTCAGSDLNICHVEAAFKAGASEAAAAQVDEIIARWYGSGH